MTTLVALLSAQESEASLTFWEQVAQFFGAENPADLLSWEFWLVLTILLVAGEILTMGFLLGAMVPGTLLAGLLAAFGMSMSIQLLGFSIGTVAGLVLLRPLFLRRAMTGGEPSNVDALVARRAKVVAAIPAGGIGEVKVQSEAWRATCSLALEVGTDVTVVSVEGNTLTVAPA
jgi:membrane protein implicated in regulation of membrane protease activity